MSDASSLPNLPARRARRHWIIEGAAIQWRVISALIMREMQTRFGRHNLGFLWLFLEPLVLGTVLGLMHSTHGRSMPGGVDPFLFSIVGYVPFFMFRSVVNRSGTALHSNLTLLFHRQVTPVDVLVSRNLLEAAAVFGVILLVLGVAIWWAGVWPADVSEIFFAMLLMFFLCHGVSMILAAGVANWEGLERLIHPVTYLSMPLSGAFFALAWLPPELREVLLWNPLVHLHEMIREGMFGHAFPSYYDVGYVVRSILIVNLLGLAYLRGARRKLEIF